MNFDFFGKQNGVPFIGGTSRGYTLVIGSGSFVEGFESQMIGMTRGENKTIKITFPLNYDAELAGKTVTFDLKINSIKKA